MSERHGEVPEAAKLKVMRCPDCGMVVIRLFNEAAAPLMQFSVDERTALEIADDLVNITEEPEEVVGHA